MIKFIWLFIILLTFNAQHAQSSSGIDEFLKYKIQMDDPDSLGQACDVLDQINKSAETTQILHHLLKEQFQISGANRHELTRNLNYCSPQEDSKVLILAFEGTGAFEPRIPALLNSFLKCAHNKLNPKIKNNFYDNSNSLLYSYSHLLDSREQKWSGLDIGILSQLFKIENAHKVDWFSFPSEESEALSDVKSFKNYSFKQLINDIRNSVSLKPSGMVSAKICLENYLNESIKMNIKPRVVLVSHSSGARSLIKFAEQMKTENIDFDLAITIDPVKEAHDALMEVFPQKIGEPARWSMYKWRRFWGENPIYPYSRVWSRFDHKRLYKPSNVKKLLSFYQLDDTLGLKLGGDPLRFGIQGSQVAGADKNTRVYNQGDSGHGVINYDPVVLKSFTREISRLLN